MDHHFRDIHIGTLIKKRVAESEIEISRICNLLACTVQEAEHMFSQKDLPTDVLLKWSRLLEYDFFRLYSQHLILYAPPSSVDYNKTTEENKKKSTLPQFRKNLYTKEIIEFMLEKIRKREMTMRQVMDKYKIPKTTLYKWMKKY
ncbi:transposase [Chryseobacterium sp. FH2]|uniref:hypothetical protein n=1 Tax=Chryseobacterium sp. FH2 TaxID=1674291 RepID=UPI00065AC86D|nr:hypothetical protein [Chryseobacterium sp. FH2]KMQ69186.1 transposase [Chryseobacterium sp. FH2]